MGTDELRIMNCTWRDKDECRGDEMDTAQLPRKNRLKIFYFI